MDHSDQNLVDSTYSDAGCMLLSESDFTCDLLNEDDFLDDFLNTNNFSSEIDDVYNVWTDERLQDKDLSRSNILNNPILSDQLTQEKLSSFTLSEYESSQTFSQSEASKKGSLSRCSTRASKRKVNLSSEADDFKNLFYQIFTSKKRFPKELIKQIHEIILIPCQLKRMSREEYRRIDLYFQEYAKFSDRILIYLQKHKEELLDAIPELSKY